MPDFIEVLPAEAQPRYKHCAHDSLQYHFFAGRHVFAARLFRTESLDHSSVWMFEDQVEELFNSNEPIEQSDANHPDVRVGGLILRAGEEDGVIKLYGAERDLEIEFRVQQAYAWREPLGTVVHQPNLVARIRFDGATLDGVGYCKRYCWDAHPNHWGYRFIHGVSEDQSDFVWTADATFGLAKYAYFKILTRGGILKAAAIPDSCHRDEGAYATIDNIPYTLRIEELGSWQAELKSDRMDSLMTQRVCRMTLCDGKESISGPAINELCFGTLR